MESNQGTAEGTQTGGATGHETPGPWVAQFSEDLRANPAWTGMRTINELGKSYLDLQGKASEADGLKQKLEGAIIKPGDNATSEEMEAFYRSIGRPDKAEEYQFDDVQLPESLSQLREYDSEFKNLFHNLGLTPSQAKFAHKGIMDMILTQGKRNAELAEKYQREISDTLRTEWKDSYDANIELARRGIRKAGELSGMSEQLIKFMDDSRLGDNPMFIKMFHAIGKAISEDTALGAGGQFKKEEERPTTLDGRPRLRFPSMEKKT